MKDRLLEEILSSVPKLFVAKMIEVQPLIYRESRDATYSGPVVLGDADAEYLWPHYRRALYETRLREVAAGCGLKAGVEVNAAGNHKYTVVKAGRFLMTCSHVGDLSMLQPSLFRGQNSALNALLPQLLLKDIADDVRQGGELYAIILHCEDRQERGLVEPGFLKFGVPAAGKGDKLEVAFDFSELLAAYGSSGSVAAPELEIGLPRLKKQTKRKEG